MRLSSAIDAVASSVHHAALSALPALEHRKRDFAAMAGWSSAQRLEAERSGAVPYIETTRRPDVSECEVVAMFAQTWGSTALGFGGIGGAAMTPAYTVVVRSPDGTFAVYWAGHFAYLVPSDATQDKRDAFQADLSKRYTVSVSEAEARYGAVADSEVEA